MDKKEAYCIPGSVFAPPPRRMLPIAVMVSPTRRHPLSPSGGDCCESHAAPPLCDHVRSAGQKLVDESTKNAGRTPRKQGKKRNRHRQVRARFYDTI